MSGLPGDDDYDQNAFMAEIAPHLPVVRSHVLNSVHSHVTIKAALARAVFILRKQGNGPYDNTQADILEELQWRDR